MTAPGASRVSTALARDRLGAAAVVFFVLSAAAPLTVVAGVVSTGFAVTGVTGLPVAFLAIAAVLAVFSVGYVAMARHVANSGAFYAYVTHGLGRPLGVAAAWVALLAYNALQVGLYGAFGVAAAPLAAQWFGVSAPWWVLALLAWALVAALGVLRVDVNGTVLAVLLTAEVAAIVVFSVASVADPGPQGVALSTLAPGNLLAPGVGAILALAVLGFVGFEQAVVFSEEARSPRRTVPFATYASIALIAGLYAFAAWAVTVGAGPAQVVERARADGPELLFLLAGERLGQGAVHAGHALFVTSLLAAMISFHNTAARYAFALGREGVLPRALGRTSRRSGAPKVGSLTQSALGFAVVVTYAWAGWDPLVRLFFWGGTAGGLGVLFLIAVTALAVLAFFVRHPCGEPGWRRLAAPALAIVALGVVVWLAAGNLSLLFGTGPGSPVPAVVLGGYLCAALLGVGWALWLRLARPATYATIGLGPRAVTATRAATPVVRPGWAR